MNPCQTKLLALSLFLAVLLRAVGAGASPLERTEPATLPELLARFEQSNPGLVMARRQIAAAQARAAYAGSLESPRLSAAVMNVPSLSGPSVTLSQGIPGGDKRRLMAEAATQETEMVRQDYERQRLAARSELEQSFYEVSTFDQAIRINQRIHAQLTDMLKAATAKYAVGSGLLQDSIRAQVEIGKLDSSRFEFERKLATARAKVNRLVNRALDAPVATVTLPLTSPPPDEEALTALAFAHSPMLKGLKAQIVASEAQRAIALQDARVPDFDVGVQVGRSMPGDMGYVGGMVGINLPWLAAGRYQQRADEASQSVAIQQARWRAQESDTRLRIRERLDQLEQSRKQVELARRMLVPQSQQAINAALGAYRVNKADFTTVLEAEKALFETQMDSITALGEYHKTWAMLEEEVGVPIDLPKEETR